DHRRADPGCLEGASGSRFSELSGRHVGSTGCRRAARAQRTPVVRRCGCGRHATASEASRLMRAAPTPDVVQTAADDSIDRHEYELNDAEFMRCIVRPGDTVIDVGAHVGLHTALLAHLVGPSGEVLALEPCSAHVARLDAALCAAGLSKRVSIISAAA